MSGLGDFLMGAIQGGLQGVDEQIDKDADVNRQRDLEEYRNERKHFWATKLRQETRDEANDPANIQATADAELLAMIAGDAAWQLKLKRVQEEAIASGNTARAELVKNLMQEAGTDVSKLREIIAKTAADVQREITTADALQGKNDEGRAIVENKTILEQAAEIERGIAAENTKAAVTAQADAELGIKEQTGLLAIAAGEDEAKKQLAGLKVTLSEEGKAALIAMGDLDSQIAASASYRATINQANADLISNLSGFRKLDTWFDNHPEFSLDNPRTIAIADAYFGTHLVDSYAAAVTAIGPNGNKKVIGEQYKQAAANVVSQSLASVQAVVQHYIDLIPADTKNRAEVVKDMESVLDELAVGLLSQNSEKTVLSFDAFALKITDEKTIEALGDSFPKIQKFMRMAQGQSADVMNLIVRYGPLPIRDYDTRNKHAIELLDKGAEEGAFLYDIRRLQEQMQVQAGALAAPQPKQQVGQPQQVGQQGAGLVAPQAAEQETAAAPTAQPDTATGGGLLAPEPQPAQAAAEPNDPVQRVSVEVRKQMDDGLPPQQIQRNLDLMLNKLVEDGTIRETDKPQLVEEIMASLAEEG